jgi:predicted O-methyltransferase YrrM
MYKRLLILITPILFAFSQPHMPEPYRSVYVLPLDLHGWYENAPQMERLIKRRHVKTVVEVGSWLGRSTTHIASCLPSDGKVYAVDHWQGNIEQQPGQQYYYKALGVAYEQFLSNVIHTGMVYKIIPMKMESREAVEEFKTRNIIIDLVYIDANHDTESVYRFLQEWYPFVKGHGVLCGDDWTWPSVVAAVRRFAEENNLVIVASGNFWELVHPS